MILAAALLAFSLHAAPAPGAGPVLNVERAAYVRTAHATLVRDEGKTFASVAFRLGVPAVQARRTVTVVGLAQDGSVLFERTAVATQGMNDARFQRAVDARVRVELPDVAGLSELRVRAGR